MKILYLHVKIFGSIADTLGPISRKGLMNDQVGMAQIISHIHVNDGIERFFLN